MIKILGDAVGETFLKQMGFVSKMDIASPLSVVPDELKTSLMSEGYTSASIGYSLKEIWVKKSNASDTLREADVILCFTKKSPLTDSKCIIYICPKDSENEDLINAYSRAADSRKREIDLMPALYPTM